MDINKSLPVSVPAAAAAPGGDSLGDDTAEGHEEAPADIFSGYEASVGFGNPHPSPVVESALLASVKLPELQYPNDVFTKGKTGDVLSALQYEGVLHACQRHRTILPDGTRAGFFLGDGAGVGKGRQISGIIREIQP